MQIELWFIDNRQIDKFLQFIIKVIMRMRKRDRKKRPATSNKSKRVSGRHPSSEATFPPFTELFRVIIGNWLNVSKISLSVIVLYIV